MIYTADAITVLAERCAPAVHPATMTAIVLAESSGRDHAINVNGRRIVPPSTVSAAIDTAHRHIRAGYSVDLGLAQINSNNLGWLALTVEQAFDPCRNLAAASRVLAEAYRSALPGRTPQQALRVAFSIYNTGHSIRGFRNGYVARVENANRRAAGGSTADPASPAITDAPNQPSPELPAPARTAILVRAAPDWDVFGRTARSAVMLFQPANP